MLCDVIARQRGPLGLETSIWACLMSFKHEIYQISIKWTDLDLLNMDFLDDTAAIHGSRLTISRFTKDESSNELVNPEILANNHFKCIYNFALLLITITLADIISSCACIVLLSEASSSSHVILQHCASARTPGL